jgi:uncharacterized protein
MMTKNTHSKEPSHVSSEVLEKDHSSFHKATRSLLAFIHRHPYLVFSLCLVITICAAGVGQKLKLRTKIQDLLPDHAPSVVASRSLSERLGSVDLLVLTLMTDDFSRVKEILPTLQEELDQLDEVRITRWEQDVSLIRKNALITFPSVQDLQEAYTDLREEIRKRVKKNMRLLDDDSKDNIEPLSTPLSDEEKFRSRLKETIMNAEGYTFSWGELESDAKLGQIGQMFRELDTDYPQYFHNAAYTTIGIKIFPSQSSNDIQFCERLVKRVEEVAHKVVGQQLGEVSPQGVVRRLDLGGTYVNVLGQSKKIKGDMLSSTVSSFVLLSLVLILAFRSIRGLVCVLLPLAMGTIWTVGLMSITVGYLNLITAFIFAVLLGLGIDFGIHFYGRFREERALGANAFDAMLHTHLSCGHASILAATTTSAAFLALTLADFRGLSQFGGVAALGVMLCFLSVWIVLPSIVFMWERWAPLKLLGYRVQNLDDQDSDSSVINLLGGRVALVGICLGLIGLALAPLIQLELNFNRLGPHPTVKSKLSEQELSANSVQYGTTKATSPTVAFAKSPEEARYIYDQLDAQSDVSGSRIKSAQSLYSLIPTQQKERIKWVKKLCRKLKRKYKLFEGDQRSGSEALLKHCDPRTFTADELPTWVVEQFTDRQGVVGGFVFISPRGSTSDGENALAFHKEMQQIKTLEGTPPMVAGKTMVWAEVLTAMKYDGTLTFSVALILVLCLLALFERSIKGLLFVSAPLLLGLGFTTGMMALFEIRLNFFNLLALPTLIGMGVDDGVHMHHRYRELGRHSAAYIVKTTGRAATLTTLTTSIGFASLMLADHRGLNSLGLLSVLGMSAALFSTLIVLPALFNWWDRRSVIKEHTNTIAHLSVLLCIVGCVACEDSPLGFLEGDRSQGRDAQVITEMRDQFSNLPVPDLMLNDMRTLAGDMIVDDQSIPSQPCLSPCDCLPGLSCIQGMCAQGETITYCCTHSTCPSGEACVEPSGERRICNTCQDACDCPYGERCEAGSCVATTIPVFCCGRSPCPSGEACEGGEGEEGSICPNGCQTACDCWGGQACVNGRCVRENEAAYCCERALCPQSAICEYDDGSSGRCPVSQCMHACDCSTGFACVNGECHLSEEQGLTYCCEDIECPAGRACELLNGGVSTCVGEPQCSVSCDCATAQICEAGRCVFPPADEPLLVCCESECGALMSGVACERLNGERTECP